METLGVDGWDVVTVTCLRLVDREYFTGSEVRFNAMSNEPVVKGSFDIRPDRRFSYLPKSVHQPVDPSSERLTEE